MTNKTLENKQTRAAEQAPSDAPNEEGSAGQLAVQSPAKRVRITPEPISQTEIDELCDLYRNMRRSALKTVRDMVKLGERCCAIKARLRHGQWGPWVTRNLNFTIRTATRAMQTYHRFKSDPALLDDPEDFMAQIYGNDSRKLKDTSDVEKTKSDVTSEIDNTDEECYEEESKPASLSHEEWTGIQIVRELGKSLDAYLAQPIAQRDKLMALLCAYDALVSRIEPQATKLGLSLDQALAMKRTA